MNEHRGSTSELIWIGLCVLLLLVTETLVQPTGQPGFPVAFHERRKKLPPPSGKPGRAAV